MNGKVFFISGIDTNIGKTYATAILAKSYQQKGINVITQKMIQTGCRDVSEDIEVHRSFMSSNFTQEDQKGLTCPYIFTYPASPHLAAKIDKRTIDCEKIHSATEILSNRYDIVLLEGAGGLMVPITNDLTTIDYIEKYRYPVILVTSGRLGSINHTLLSLQACQTRNIEVEMVIYNLFPKEDTLISNDTFDYIKQYLQKNHPSARLFSLPETGFESNFTFPF